MGDQKPHILTPLIYKEFLSLRIFSPTLLNWRKRLSFQGCEDVRPIKPHTLTPSERLRSPTVEVWKNLSPFVRPGVSRKLGGAAGFAQGGDGRVPDFERGFPG